MLKSIIMLYFWTLFLDHTHLEFPVCYANHTTDEIKYCVEHVNSLPGPSSLGIHSEQTQLSAVLFC